MNVLLSVVDYNTAKLCIREKLSFTISKRIDFYNNIKYNKDILGAVIISTCNRTEIYLSLKDNILLHPFEILCSYLSLDFNQLKTLCFTLKDKDALHHLCLLSCGAESAIFGEDQILTQVKEALLISRENNCADNILEVMFKKAITSAKKIKTSIDFKANSRSIANCTLDIIKSNKSIDFNIKKVLVIGNGVIGRLCCEYLVNNNYDVTMTLRQYKYKNNIIPKKVQTIEYSKRYIHLNDFDCIISATTSPHFTIEFNEVKINKAMLFIDLALPRDIDPLVNTINNAICVNIDDISSVSSDRADVLNEINVIINKYIIDFYKWLDYKEKLQIG